MVNKSHCLDLERSSQKCSVSIPRVSSVHRTFCTFRHLLGKSLHSKKLVTSKCTFYLHRLMFPRVLGGGGRHSRWGISLTTDDTGCTRMMRLDWLAHRVSEGVH